MGTSPVTTGKQSDRTFRAAGSPLTLSVYWDAAAEADDVVALDDGEERRPRRRVSRAASAVRGTLG